MTTGTPRRSARKKSIENHLLAVREQIDKHLAGLIKKSAPTYLYQPIRYALNLRGKRLRPALLMLTCDSLKGSMKKCLPPAVAIELLHSFTLVHDDIMDQDDMRRGQPTLHNKWDEAVALLAGDGLIALAYLELLNTKGVNLPQLADIFSKAILTVCEGQALDKEFEEKFDVSVRAYQSMIEKKTAALMSVSAEIGALMAGGTAAQVKTLGKFGHDIGIAFQIQDDLLDIISDEATLGKDIGSDIEQGKKTYPLLMLQERANRKDEVHLKTLVGYGAGAMNAWKLREVKKLLWKYDVLKDTQKAVDRWINRAVQQLEGAGKPAKPELLLDLATLIQNRSA
jgi:geranylgeranyl diphosphate synthase, type II